LLRVGAAIDGKEFVFCGCRGRRSREDVIIDTVKKGIVRNARRMILFALNV